MTNNTAHSLLQFDCNSVPSPCYVIDESALKKNLEVLAKIQNESKAKILLALKAFSMFECAPLISRYLAGTCASGLYEARLGNEKFNGEVHTYSPAYRPQEFAQILHLSDHVVFNSFLQWKKYREASLITQKNKPNLSFGLRVNPEHSEGATAIYDPCAPHSRMGITHRHFEFNEIEGIDGLHFHTLCEQDFSALERTLDVIEQQYAKLLPKLKWINFGGGHHITREGYQVDQLIKRLITFQHKYQIQVYLEPGEAIALNTGILVTEVLDIIQNDMSIVILDTSATCHMPDVLEMPYRPHITHSGEAQQKNYTYRLGGSSCLSGDIVGNYSFDEELYIGKRLMFEDMAIYTMVKNTTFNGVPLPSIALFNSETRQLKYLKQFSYSDFYNRLS